LVNNSEEHTVDDSHGQLNSSLVHQQDGRTHSYSLLEMAYEFYALVDTIPVEARASHIPGVTNVLADALSRPFKSNGMDVEQGLSLDMSTARCSESRSLCNQVQPSTSSVHFTCAGSRCSGGGCSEHQLGRPGRLCLSSGSADPSGTSEVSHAQLSDSFGSALLAQSSVVSGPFRFGRTRTNKATRQKRSINTSSHETLPSRVEVLSLHVWVLRDSSVECSHNELNPHHGI